IEDVLDVINGLAYYLTARTAGTRTAEDVPALYVGEDIHIPIMDVAPTLRKVAVGIRDPPWRQRLVVVLGIHQHGQPLLLHVAQAACLPRLLPRLGEDREEDRSQDGDDGNDYE